MKYSIEDYYYACYNNVIDMCKDRGYTTKNNVDFDSLKLDRTDEKFESHQQDPNILDIMPGTIIDNNNIPVYVTFIEQGRANQKFLTTILDKIIEKFKNKFNISNNSSIVQNRKALFENLHCIIIHSNELKSGSQLNKNFELFHTHKFFLNITKHSIVPQHIMLTPEEKKKIFETKNIGASTCSKILTDDPVNLYYNGQPGDVYKIIRESKSIYFRIVVNGNPFPFASQFKRLKTQEDE